MCIKKQYLREYTTWQNMMARCYKEREKDSPNYKERGITVCDRWKKSFWNFLEDMGPKPEGLTLERLNNDKGYYPENCVWADRKQQAINRRMFKNNTSGETGVHLRADSGRWRAYVNRDGQRVNLGTFASKEEAVEARSKYLQEIN